MRPFAFVTVIALLGCEGPFVPPAPYPPPPPEPASVRVTPDSATVITDDTLRLVAQVKDTAGNVLTGAVLSWVSSDTTIVTIVNALGTVRGLRPGSATVRVYAGAVGGAVTVFVTPIVYNSFATGANHVCAVANNRHAYCWGKNDDAEIGTGSASLVERVPRLVLLAPAVSSVAAGDAHSCALDVTGKAYCWGREESGRLGRGSVPGDPAVPSPVATGALFATIATGSAYSCALESSGPLLCWGADGYGQLGDGQSIDRATTAPVFGDTDWQTISTGSDHACAIAADRTAWCWGHNAVGAVGDSTTTDRAVPTAVTGGIVFAELAAGGAHTCGVTPSGAAYCWGRNTQGQTGSSLPDSVVVTPASVSGGTMFLQVTAGTNHSCGIATDSLAYCWGANGNGQLGDSSTTDRPAPVPVAGALHFTMLRAGGAYTCGLTTGLVLYCWGDGSLGQLGQALLGSSSVPVKVAGQ